MRKLFLAFCISALTGLSAFAQIDDYKKGEFFIGYSNNQVDTGIAGGDEFSDFVDERESFHGARRCHRPLQQPRGLAGIVTAFLKRPKGVSHAR